MNNDEVRELIRFHGITVANVTDKQLEKLHKELSIGLENSQCFNGKFRMNESEDLRFMTCRSDNFDDREAVSFNRDGFIGFAGWSSTNNTKPILKAVIKWATDIGRGYPPKDNQNAMDIAVDEAQERIKLKDQIAELICENTMLRQNFVPVGYVLVPKEMTQEMIEAVAAARIQTILSKDVKDSTKALQHEYKAMLKAV